MLRRQLEPMLMAVKTLAALSQPDQHLQPLPVARQDEIGTLIGGFNHLLLQLGQREALLKQILNTSSVAIFLVDPKGFITQANQRMSEMFGYPVEALLGQEYVSLVNPAERDEARQKMLALLASAIPAVDLDRLYWRADQTEFWGHLSGKRFVDANGQEHGLIGVIADISKRKSAEEKLLKHDQVLSAVINNFPGGMTMVDSDLRVTAYNPQLKSLLDFPDELFEKPDLKLADLLRYNAQRGEYGPGDIDELVASGVDRARRFEAHKFERVRPDGTVLEVCGVPVPGGGFVTLYLDITERKQLETGIRQLAFYDPLTHLPNRRLLGDRLTQALADSKRSGDYGAVMFLDLDNFKALNDTHGHKAGDMLLIEAAHRLKNCVREVDTVARLGGDEFVVMVGDLDRGKAPSTAQANAIAEKIRLSMADPYGLNVARDESASVMVEHRCTASIGVAVFISSEGSDEDFLRWADAAMYQAKVAGGNQIRFHQGES
jgi:diguanylate cyclase (GGDEF)-like protein/PAS domain S-box-containing protein